MNKADLVDEVQKLLSSGTSRAEAERATDAVLSAVKRGLRRDKEVSLVGAARIQSAYPAADENPRGEDRPLPRRQRAAHAGVSGGRVRGALRVRPAGRVLLP
jgi:hypothetical protein